MAQIQIEERRRGLGWLWAIIAIVILALIVWYFAAGNDASDVNDTPTTTAPATPTTIDAPAPATPAAAA